MNFVQLMTLRILRVEPKCMFCLKRSWNSKKISKKTTAALSLYSFDLFFSTVLRALWRKFAHHIPYRFILSLLFATSCYHFILFFCLSMIFLLQDI